MPTPIRSLEDLEDARSSGGRIEALRFAGSSAALRGTTLTYEQGLLQKKPGAALVVARCALGAARSDRAFEEGMSLPLTQAIQETQAVFGVPQGKVFTISEASKKN